MRKVILGLGIFLILLFTVCTFFKDDIVYLVDTNITKMLYEKQEGNDYTIDATFDYIKPYSGLELRDRNDILPSIFYSMNLGVDETNKYCAKDYANCYAEVGDIANKSEILSLLNNFVHPYNTFEKITISGDNDIIKLQFQHLYTDDEIEAINEVVDKVINEKITNNMPTREKIKVIHDYIIDNADYDTLKTDNINDTTYKSNTAYGVLIQGYGICSGYADAMAIFLDKLDIINYRISNDKHIWNLVYLDGEWYHLDLTWDDPVTDINTNRDTYFLIDTETLKLINDGTHYFDYSIFSEAE